MPVDVGDAAPVGKAWTHATDELQLARIAASLANAVPQRARFVDAG